MQRNVTQLLGRCKRAGSACRTPRLFSASRHFSSLGRSDAWLMAEGAGARAPTSQGLRTDRYTALLNTHNSTVLQLYHGSTGAVMFRSGPASTTSAQNTAHADTTASKGYEVVNFGYRRVCWLGWDGSFKEGLEGRQDFSSWLCPEVIRALEAGEGRSLPATTRHLAGYWVMEFADPSTCAVISNTESKVQIVLTAEGFIFQPEKKVLLTPGLLAQIDADGSGTISTEELDEALNSKWSHLTSAERDVIKTADLRASEKAAAEGGCGDTYTGLVVVSSGERPLIVPSDLVASFRKE